MTSAVPRELKPLVSQKLCSCSTSLSSCSMYSRAVVGSLCTLHIAETCGALPSSVGVEHRSELQVDEPAPCRQDERSCIKSRPIKTAWAFLLTTTYYLLSPSIANRFF